jgi:hypothetical protein
MIRYQLNCAKGHQFEAWFPSSAGFDAQAAKGLVACPDCGSTKVEKALMAPNVVTSERKRASRRTREEPVPAQPPTAPAGKAEAQPAGRMVLNGPQREMLRKLKEVRDKVLAEAEYVGPRFAEEARKIHHEESPSRGIYGEASPDEVQSLSEDGIDVFPIPVLPEDQN